jgi:hypothetical protein
MYHGFWMNAGKPPVAIRITRPYATEDEFLAAELDTISRTGVTLVGAQQRPEGVVLRFELALGSGAPLLRGEGRVVGYKANAVGNEPGLALRFTRLDSKSKALVDRVSAMRETRRSMAPPPPAPSAPQVPEPMASGDIPVAAPSSAEKLEEPKPEPKPIVQARDREGMLARLRERAASISQEQKERIFADGAARRAR